jgi:hypothetical protein
MKKILSLLLTVALLCGAVVGLSACSGGNPPPLEEVYDRIVTVVEASHEVNVLLFGAGLPVYPRGDAEDDLIHRYYGVADDGREYVTPYTKYKSIDQMQSAIAAVYSVRYRESLYETLFTGYADGDIMTVMPARFQEDERALYQSKYVESLVSGVRVYDYAAMEIVGGSNATRIRVAIPSYSESKPDVWTTVTLSFVYENGDWYLDSPSC